MNDERKTAKDEADSTSDTQTDMDRARVSATAEIAERGQSTSVGRGPESSGDREPLMSSDAAAQFRSRWERIQAAFVDDPQSAVKDADGLVAEAMQHLAKTFASERSNLERQWSTGGEASTEDL